MIVTVSDGSEMADAERHEAIGRGRLIALVLRLGEHKIIECALIITLQSLDIAYLPEQHQGRVGIVLNNAVGLRQQFPAAQAAGTGTEKLYCHRDYHNEAYG